MNNKFLPIGTICTLKGKNKKIMIAGFYSVQFNGNLKINDYYGYVYPEGLLLPESICTFNHSDIESINFMGYENDDHKKLNQLLGGLTSNPVTNDNENYKKDDWVLASSQSYSKLLFDENGVVVLAEPVVSNKTDNVNNNIKFDENGIVVSVEEKNVENPFYKDYNSASNNSSNENDNSIFEKYKFDENGILIEEKVEEKNDEIESSHPINLSNATPQYKFDENGILVAIENEENK